MRNSTIYFLVIELLLYYQWVFLFESTLSWWGSDVRFWRGIPFRIVRMNTLRFACQNTLFVVSCIRLDIFPSITSLFLASWWSRHVVHTEIKHKGAIIFYWKGAVCLRSQVVNFFWPPFYTRKNTDPCGPMQKKAVPSFASVEISYRLGARGYLFLGCTSIRGLYGTQLYNEGTFFHKVNRLLELRRGRGGSENCRSGPKFFLCVLLTKEPNWFN